MGALTDTCPKPMLPIAGKPKLEYTLRSLPTSVAEVIFIVGYLGEVIEKHFGDHFAGKRIRYVRQRDLNGTGGAIHQVRDLLEERFLVIMGDDLYLREDLERLSAYRLAVLGCEVEDSTAVAVLSLDSFGNLLEIRERPHDGTNKLINTGAYALTRAFFHYPLVMLPSGELGLPQTLVTMKEKHNIEVVIAKNWFPIGNPEALREAQNVVNQFL